MKWRTKEGLPTSENLLEYRSLNRHVSIYTNDLKHQSEPQKIRQRILELAKPNVFRGLSIGAILSCDTLPQNIDDFMKSIDSVQKERSVWQWTIIHVKELKLAIGLHTWMKVFSTSIFEQNLNELNQSGYEIEKFTKEKGKLMSILTTLNPKYH